MSDRKAVIVTGASRGIGAAIALELARRGHMVGCLSRQGHGPEGIDAPAEICARLVPLAADISDPPAVEAAFAAFAEKAGRIDALVNNAGIHREAPSDRQPIAAFEEMLAVNTTATFAACQRVFPYLKAAGGLIVNIGSMFAEQGVRRNAAYCASKAAVAAFGRCLAVEWARHGIRVLTVAPGYVETDITRETLASAKVRDFLAARIPAGGPAKPDAIARLIAALVAEDIPFLTGETIHVDGGQRIAL